MNPEKLAQKMAGVYPPIQPPREKVDPLPRNHPRPTKVVEMKMLRSGVRGKGLLVFMQRDMLDICVVGSRAIEAFGWDGSKILQREFGDRGFGGEGCLGLCAVYVEGRNVVVVGHDDKIVREYDMMSGNMGSLKRVSSVLDTLPMCLFYGEDIGILVGGKNGSVRILDESLELKKVIEPPSLKVTVDDPYNPLCVCSLCLFEYPDKKDDEIGQGDASTGILIGRSGGMVCSKATRTSFCAHAGETSRIITRLGCIIITAGSKDASLAVFLSSGVCIARKSLDYSPTTMSPVAQTNESKLRQLDCICPSENAFLVGGANGQVDVYRCVIYAPNSVELTLIRRISSRQRGPRRGIMSLMYSGEDSVIIGANENGDIRRWRMTDLMASTLSLTEYTTGAYNEKDITTALSKLAEKKKETRVATLGGIVVAQRYMAKLLGDDFVKDVHKDMLVESFQKCQADMQSSASEADEELHRAVESINNRFSESLDASTEVKEEGCSEARMIKAARRTAAVELGYAVGQHAAKLKEVERAAMMFLGRILLKSIKSKAGESGDRAHDLEQMREQVENLCKGHFTTEVAT